jgi:hypothetical protein
MIKHRRGERFMRANHFMLFLLFIGVLGWMMTGCGQAEKPAEKASVERTSEVTLSAVVEAVDYDARTFTLKDENDNIQTLQVQNPDIPMEKLKTGDQLTMTIFQKEVNYVADPGQEIPTDESLRTVGAKMGEEETNITVVNAQNMTTTVTEIDLPNRMVTLMMEDGTPMTLPVQDDVENLDQLEVGDKVVMQVTQVISVSIDK